MWLKCSSVCSQVGLETSRELHKSVPYLRLRNSKGTSKCQVFFFSTRKTQKLHRIGALKGGALGFSISILSQNFKKNERGKPLGRFFRKKNFTMKKQTGRGSFSRAWYCRSNFVELFWSVLVD